MSKAAGGNSAVLTLTKPFQRARAMPKRKEKTIQYQELTTDTATVLVEVGEDWAGLATCEPSRRRRSGMNIGASPRLRRAPPTLLSWRPIAGRWSLSTP
jgi:hypothetical protein